MISKNNSELERFKCQLDKCTGCGYCTLWCPIYQEDPRESSVARGKIKMLKALLAGESENDADYEDKLNRCMLCGTCAEHCQGSTETQSTIIASRADKTKAQGLPFPYSFIYRWLIPRRVLFGNTVRIASWFQGFLPKTEGTIRHLPLFLTALGKGRNIPSIAPKFLRQLVPEVSKPSSGTKKMRVGYFSGCMTDFVFPQVGKNIIEILNNHGVEVVFPKEQGCCGTPVYQGAGDFETGRKLADANIRAFADLDVEYIICNCATCISSISDYEKFLADTPERKEAYRNFASKLKDITEFLVDVLQLPASSYKVAPEVKGKTITWHDPCHLNRYMGITKQPRQILKSIPDINFVEMTRPDWCCGMAGTFSIKYYETSKKIADKKIESIKDSGADILVTDCPGCMIQIMDNCVRHKLPVKVMHITELLR
ncbi:(Fe-S)-binding protein [Zhaonella formicivorans]|uniref:(Fe-S)-binding protein n=1 Tax=Zhaonella formicivorans TaxID=2528593 RepID=UPI0010E671D0|nr:(Fe-S)-binding protein [Zhaonella formicivorans]